MNGMKGLEKEIQRDILRYLALRGLFHYKNNTVGIFKQATGTYIPSPSKGAPDIVCILKGRFIGLEVKTPKGKLSDDQGEFHRQILKAGGIVFTVRSLDEAIEAVEDTMKRL
jgi:penicillin-binding protein-related factor A (putative recombinase)